MIVALPIVPTLTMVEEALDRPPQSTAYLLSMGQGARELEEIARVTRGLAQGGGTANGRTQILSNALGTRGGATWQGMPYPCASPKPVQGTKGIQLIPLPAKATPASSRPCAFPPQTRTKTSWHEGSQMKTQEKMPNKAPVIVDGQKVTALIDSGAQVSSISSGFCDLLALVVQPLGRMLELGGTGGSVISYMGNMEVNLQIPGIKSYNEDILLLVIPTMTYSEKVLVMVRSEIIDWAVEMMTKGELTRQLQTGQRLTSVQLCLAHSICPAQLQRMTEK